jgi:hypothetical protein
MITQEIKKHYSLKSYLLKRHVISPEESYNKHLEPKLLERKIEEDICYGTLNGGMQ